MPTELLPTRTPTDVEQKLAPGLALAIALHGIVAGALVLAAYLAHNKHHWGDQDPAIGSIQASMVSSIPLPAKLKPVDKEVLASDHPSIAPTPTPPEPHPRTPDKSKAEPPPKPNEVPIPSKVPPPSTKLKPSPTPAPDTPRHPPAAATPSTPKATTGDAAATQIPTSVTQLKNGTASLTVDDRPFGDRNAYYIRLISQKIAQSKSQGDQDPAETRGKRSTVRFVIERDGTPADITVETRSGSGALDTSTLRAIQRIDSFGPLPQGSQLVVHFEWESK